MRNFKKFLTLVLAVMMVVSMVAVNTSAATFTDVDENNDYLVKSVNLLSYLGVTKGTSETEFGTAELVTREQMAAFIYRLMKKGQSVEGGENTSNFTDLEDPTFFFMVSWAASQGIIKGTSATTFEPKGSITLQDAYVMVVRALGYEKEEQLPYPFGYIEIAEKKDVELNEGLSSSVGYTTPLTRGDVAIILYNAFFAETGVAETKQVEKKIGTDDKATWVLKTETEYPTFCEKYFDVLEVEYETIATPHFAFDEEEQTTADLGYDAVYLRIFEREEGCKAPEYFYADVKDLDITGSPDDYIMGHFKMYITLDKDEKKVETILYAEPLLVKKTVSDIKLKSLTSNTKASYYGDDANNAKRLSGEAIVDGASVYFYNAPYSYAKPTYEIADDTDQLKYDRRNEKDVKFITRTAIDVDDEEFKFEKDLDIFDGTYDPDGIYVWNSLALGSKLAQVYADGLYEATFYDVDGDDLYDYIEYMPYEFAIVDTDDDKTFLDDGWSNDDDWVVYTNEAKVAGEKFKDEDFIIGYFNQDCNYIKVLAVVEPIKGAVKSISGKKVTLSDGTKASVNEAWRLVTNYDLKIDDDFYKDILEGNNYNIDDANDDFLEFNYMTKASALNSKDSAKYYVYNDVLLYADGVKKNVVLDKNVAIVTYDYDETPATAFQSGAFDKSTGKRANYVYAWIDGAVKYINVDTDTDSTNIWPKLDAISADDTYAGKIATYEVDANGMYTLKLAGNAYDAKEMAAKDYIGMSRDVDELKDEKDEEIQVLFELGDNLYLTKRLSRRFVLSGTPDDYTDNALPFELVLTADTKIVIKNWDDEGDVEFLEYDYSSMTDSSYTPLYNVQLVVANNKDSETRENLVFLYAEADEFDISSKTSKKADRIVKSWEPTLNSDNRVVYSYEVFNPYTGAKETILGSKNYSSNGATEQYEVGDIVRVANGKIDEAKSAIDSIIDNSNYYWILDYDANDDIIEIGEVGSEEVLFTVSVSDAAICTIGSQGQGFGEAMIKWGNVAPVAKSKLAADDKAYKTVKNDYEKKPGAKLTSIYGKYQKAYVSMEVASSKDDFDMDADYVAIILHNGENEDLCDK